MSRAGGSRAGAPLSQLPCRSWPSLAGPRLRLQGRQHSGFITRLQQELVGPGQSPAAARAAFVEQLARAAHELPGFQVREAIMAEASAALASKPLCGTKLVDLLAAAAAT